MWLTSFIKNNIVFFHTNASLILMVWIWDNNIETIIIQQTLKNHANAKAHGTYCVRTDIATKQNHQNADKKYPVMNMNSVIGDRYFDRSVMKDRIKCDVNSRGFLFISKHQQRIKSRDH